MAVFYMNQREQQHLLELLPYDTGCTTLSFRQQWHSRIQAAPALAARNIGYPNEVQSLEHCAAHAF
jgi:hypothetical protein